MSERLTNQSQNSRAVSSVRSAYIGWLLFTISGFFFLIPAIRNRDYWSLGSAITWLLGVVFFLLSMRDSGSE